MDVDNEVEGQLIQQFSSMGTTDKEVLVAEFQRLTNDDLNPSLCAFFLDMNNWNLPAAIGSYYDYEQPSNVRVPVMSFVKDVTIGEGESVPTNTSFVKTWRIQNTGSECWPPGCCLRFIQGERMGSSERVMVEALQPSSLTDVSVEMRSPPTTGIFQSQWRMQTSTGLYFGEIIWVILQVEEHGLLGVTQQLSNITSTDFTQPGHQCTASSEHTENPFGSPTMGHNPFISWNDRQYNLSAHVFGSPNKTTSFCDSETELGKNIPCNDCQTLQLPQNGEIVTVNKTHAQTEDGASLSMSIANSSELHLPTADVRNIPHTLPSSWPGTPTVIDREISAPTPNVSPNSNVLTNASNMDTAEDMT